MSQALAADEATTFLSSMKNALTVVFQDEKPEINSILPIEFVHRPIKIKE